MVHDISKANVELSDKAKFIVLLNHKYFVRSTVAAVANIAVFFFVVSVLSIIFVGVGSFVAVSNTSESVLIISYILVAFLWIVYLAFTIAKILKLLSIHEHISNIEDSLFNEKNK